MKNKTLSLHKKKKLIETFCDELTATQAAHRLSLDRNTVNKYFKRIRECIAGYREYQKMRLMITTLSGSNAQIPSIAKRITATKAAEQGIPVRIMCIDGQLLTDLETRSNGTPPTYLLNMSAYADHPGQSAIKNKPGCDLNCNDLQQLADDFHDFTTARFKKFFGIRTDYAYLFIKEAEFVYNEKEYQDRQRVLNQMMEKIFA